MDEERQIVVVQRAEHTTVVTGWRAVLLALGALLSGIAALVFLAFVFVGMALTIGAVLLVAVPVGIAFALATALLRRRG